MKSLSLDLETYSDLNLAKCGVYKSWIPEIRNESFDRVSPIIYFQEQPTAV